MAGKLTQWGAGEWIQNFFGQTTSPPSSFWLALIRETAPTLYMSGSEIDEPNNADYARVELPNIALNWSNASQPQISTLTIDATYNMATSDWGECGFWALCNAEIDGFCYFVGDLEEPLVVVTGDTAVISAGDLSFSLGPFFLADEVD